MNVLGTREKTESLSKEIGDKESHGETRTEKHKDPKKKYSGWAQQQAGRDGGKNKRTDKRNNRN